MDVRLHVICMSSCEINMRTRNSRLTNLIRKEIRISRLDLSYTDVRTTKLFLTEFTKNVINTKTSSRARYLQLSEIIKDEPIIQKDIEVYILLFLIDGGEGEYRSIHRGCQLGRHRYWQLQEILRHKCPDIRFQYLQKVWHLKPS